MIAKLHYDKHIDRKETIIATMVNSFPSSIVLSRDLLPIVVALLGTTGLIYLGIVVFIGLVKTLIALVAARLLLTPRTSGTLNTDIEKKTLREASLTALRRSKRTVMRMALTTTVVSIAIFQLMETGIFDLIADIMKSSFLVNYVPPEGLPIIAGWFASNIAAYTIAGNLLSAQMLSTRDIILALLVGRVLASVPRIKSMLPYYTGIFRPKLGLKIMTVSLIMQNGIMLAIIGIILFFW